jgi:hypothetical protein
MVAAGEILVVVNSWDDNPSTRGRPAPDYVRARRPNRSPATHRAGLAGDQDPMVSVLAVTGSLSAGAPAVPASRTPGRTCW